VRVGVWVVLQRVQHTKHRLFQFPPPGRNTKNNSGQKLASRSREYIHSIHLSIFSYSVIVVLFYFLSHIPVCQCRAGPISSLRRTYHSVGNLPCPGCNDANELEQSHIRRRRNESTGSSDEGISSPRKCSSSTGIETSKFGNRTPSRHRSWNRLPVTNTRNIHIPSPSTVTATTHFLLRDSIAIISRRNSSRNRKGSTTATGSQYIRSDLRRTSHPTTPFLPSSISVSVSRGNGNRRRRTGIFGSHAYVLS